MLLGCVHKLLLLLYGCFLSFGAGLGVPGLHQQGPQRLQLIWASRMSMPAACDQQLYMLSRLCKSGLMCCAEQAHTLKSTTNT